MSTKPPADPPMDRSANPVRPATAPAPRKPVAPPPPKSGFQRFMLQFLLLVIALGGAFSTGYLANANEMQQRQLDAQEQQERILALEQQIAELQERRERGNRVELDLTEVFEPIREAVGRIALVRMGEISREITTELTRLVEQDLPSLEDPTNATGGLAPGGMTGENAVSEQRPGPEAASTTDEAAPPPSVDGPDSLQPSSASLDTAGAPARPETVDLRDEVGDGAAPAALPAASALPAEELPASTEEAVAQEASRDAAPDSTAGRSGIVNADDATQREATVVAELASPSPPSSAGGVPPTEP